MFQLVTTATGLFHVAEVIDYVKLSRERSRLRREVRKTIHELQALSDKELWDIGISRGEIYNVAWGAFND